MVEQGNSQDTILLTQEDIGLRLRQHRQQRRDSIAFENRCAVNIGFRRRIPEAARDTEHLHHDAEADHKNKHRSKPPNQLAVGTSNTDVYHTLILETGTEAVNFSPPVYPPVATRLRMDPRDLPQVDGVGVASSRRLNNRRNQSMRSKKEGNVSRAYKSSRRDSYAHSLDRDEKRSVGLMLMPTAFPRAAIGAYACWAAWGTHEPKFL